VLYPSNLAVGIGKCHTHAPGAAEIEILIKGLGQLQIISAPLKSCGNLAALKPLRYKSNDLRETLMIQQAASSLPASLMIILSEDVSQTQFEEFNTYSSIYL